MFRRQSVKFPKVNRKGMGLVTTLVALGISSIAMMSTLALFDSQLLGQKYVEQKYGMIYVNNEIYQYLSSETACKNTFDGKNFPYPGTTPPFASPASYNDIKQIKNSGGNVVYRTFDDPMSVGTTYDSGNIKINRFTLSEYTPEENPSSSTDVLYYTGFAKLTIEFETNRRSIGLKVFTREIKLRVFLKKTGELDPFGVAYDASVDKNIAKCSAFGGAGGGSSNNFWQATSTADGIFYQLGKVGIGTTSPGYTTHIKSSTNGQQLAVESPGDATHRWSQVNFLSAGDMKSFIGHDGQDNTLVLGGQQVNAGFNSVRIRPAGGAAGVNDILVITRGGNVGISDTTPTNKLDVNGSARVTGGFTVGGNLTATGNINSNGTITAQDGLVTAGNVKVGNSGAGCNAARAGEMRYNSGVNRMQFCNGAVWANVQPYQCRVRLRGQDADSGVYNSVSAYSSGGVEQCTSAWVQINGTSSEQSIQICIECD